MISNIAIKGKSINLILSTFIINAYKLINKGVKSALREKTKIFQY